MIVFFQISLLENILEPVLKQDQFAEFIPPELGYFRETCKLQISPILSAYLQKIYIYTYLHSFNIWPSNPNPEVSGAGKLKRVNQFGP